MNTILYRIVALLLLLSSSTILVSNDEGIIDEILADCYADMPQKVKLLVKKNTSPEVLEAFIASYKEMLEAEQHINKSFDIVEKKVFQEFSKCNKKWFSDEHDCQLSAKELRSTLREPYSKTSEKLASSRQLITTILFNHAYRNASPEEQKYFLDIINQSKS